MRRALSTAGLALFASCAIDLTSMAPFPCGADGTCPDGFRCESQSAGSVCVVSSDANNCSKDADCASQGSGLWCQSNKCTACDDSGHCGDSCQACTDALPVCDGNKCVQCVIDSDCNAAGATCASQRCGCTSGTWCTDACADLNTSAENCGTCGHACAAGQTCSGGSCVQACTHDQDCTAVANEVCSNGVCTCAQTLCGNECVDITSSLTHCGDCNSPCRADQVCSQSLCQCAQNQMVCTGSCATCSGSGVPTCLSDGTFKCCPSATPVYCEAYPEQGCLDQSVYCDSYIMCPDGSWHSCSDGLQRYNCTNQECADCTAQCDGKWCGDDQCGGNCGQCPSGQTCTALGGCAP